MNIGVDIIIRKLLHCGHGCVCVLLGLEGYKVMRDCEAGLVLGLGLKWGGCGGLRWKIWGCDVCFGPDNNMTGRGFTMLVPMRGSKKRP